MVKSRADSVLWSSKYRFRNAEEMNTTAASVINLVLAWKQPVGLIFSGDSTDSTLIIVGFETLPPSIARRMEEIFKQAEARNINITEREVTELVRENDSHLPS